jgi:hypothetical protein
VSKDIEEQKEKIASEDDEEEDVLDPMIMKEIAIGKRISTCKRSRPASHAYGYVSTHQPGPKIAMTEDSE